MVAKALAVAVAGLAAVVPLSMAQQTVSTLGISEIVGGPPDCGGFVGNPSVVWNASRQEWVVVWAELPTTQVLDDARLMGARIATDGTLLSRRKILQGNIFDGELAHDGTSGKYLLVLAPEVGDTPSPFSQVLKVNLRPKGPQRLLPIGDPGGKRPVSPELVFDPVDGNFVLFAAGLSDDRLQPEDDLRMLRLSRSGEPVGTTEVVLDAPGGKSLDEAPLRVSRDPVSGNYLALLWEAPPAGRSGRGKLRAYAVRPDGSLTGDGPLQLMKARQRPACTQLYPNPSIAFSPAGIGMTMWTKRSCSSGAVKVDYRLVSNQGTALDQRRRLDTVEVPRFESTAVGYDAALDVFSPTWVATPFGEEIYGALVDATTGTLVGQPFAVVGTTLDPVAELHRLRVAHDPVSGRTLVVWQEDDAGCAHQLRGAIFETQ